MVRFYFHLKEGCELIADDHGTELPSVEAATREALRSARELLADAIRFGVSRVPDSVVIADEAGRTLHVLPMVEALPEPFNKK